MTPPREGKGGTRDLACSPAAVSIADHGPSLDLSSAWTAAGGTLWGAPTAASGPAPWIVRRRSAGDRQHA